MKITSDPSLEDKEQFETLLEGSARAHGHLCAGQVIGVRMGLLGLFLIGLPNAKNTADIKKLIVYVEMDRCTTDAIGYVTGVRLGRRSLKFMDFGVMAATFVNTETGRAFRVISTEESRERYVHYAPDKTNPRDGLIEAYKCMPLHELFKVQEVRVDIKETDLPGPTRAKVACTSCGTVVRDGKETMGENGPLCHECSGKAYYVHPLDVDILI